VGAAVFCVASFRHLATKKTGLANLTKEIFGIKKTNSPYFEGKKLEVAIFRQFGTIGGQN
jgi:hypothetical protein